MQRVALIVLAVASPLVLAFSLAGGSIAEVGFTLLVPIFPVALIALGCGTRKMSRALAVGLWTLFLVLEGSVVAMLMLRGASVEGVLLAALIQTVGILVIPLVVVTVAYALDFEYRGLTPTDLERLKNLGADQRREP